MSLQSLLFASCCLLSMVSSCTTYRKEADGACADICLDSTVGICPISIIVNAGGLSTGSCEAVGYPVADGTISQSAGPCGTLTFNKWKKALLGSSRSLSRRLSVLASISEDSFAEADSLSFDSASCPNVETIAVDPTEYFAGRWFEIAASSGFKNQFEAGLECITADYYFNKCDTSNPVVVVNNGIKNDGSFGTAFGKARQQAPGKFEVSFFGPFYGPYWVIHTESDAEGNIVVGIVFSCSRSGKSLWVLSRTPTLAEGGFSYDNLLSIVREKGIDVDSLDMVSTKQGETCSYPKSEQINNKPSSDEECSFGWTGCSPSSWCSWQFHWGDLTPSQSCRLKPSQCEASTSETLSSPEEPEVKESSTNGSEPKLEVQSAVIVVAGVAVVVASAMLVVIVRRKRQQKRLSENVLQQSFVQV